MRRIGWLAVAVTVLGACVAPPAAATVPAAKAPEGRVTRKKMSPLRRKIAERVSPDPQLVELTEVEIDVQTTVIRPEKPTS